jgi:metacaspase-1
LFNLRICLRIGINYTGQQGALSGCHNDVEGMQEFIATEGYTNTAETQLVLLDDGVHQTPTAANIKAAFE